LAKIKLLYLLFNSDLLPFKLKDSWFALRNLWSQTWHRAEHRYKIVQYNNNINCNAEWEIYIN